MSNYSFSKYKVQVTVETFHVDQFFIRFVRMHDGMYDHSQCIRISPEDPYADNYADWEVSKDVGNRIFLDIKRALKAGRPQDISAWIEWTLSDKRTTCEYHPFSWVPSLRASYSK